MGKPQTLKDLLQKLVKDYHLEKGIRQHRSIQVWQDIIEEDLKNTTRAVAFRNGKLFIEVESSTLRNELMYRRQQLTDQVNRAVGETVVESLVFINRRTYDRDV